MPNPKTPVWTTWEDMPIAEFRKRHALAKEKAAAFVAAIDELLPGLVTLTREQRKVAPRLRVGEHAMLLEVLQVTQIKPALFESLADVDEGMDPKKFEPELLAERVEKHQLLGELDETLVPISDAVADTGHYLAGKFRDAIFAAYRIAKVHAATDRAINDILAPVMDFMRKNAVTGAATRSAKKSDNTNK
ncbi:hypothetical protein A7982_13073 [Minicystis rosea]|nr:hypothetical protein A7982_13073 [Minicystis rosea]